MRRWRVTAVLLVASTSAAVSGALMLSQRRAGSVMPLTIEYREKVFLPQGTVELQPILAIRSDGSTAFSRAYLDNSGAAQEIKMILDLSAGQIVSVASSIKAKTTVPYLPPDLSNAAGFCVDYPAATAIMDHDIVSQRVRWKPPGGDDRSYEFLNHLAPDLGCRMLASSVVRIDADGSQKEARRTEVVSIRPGEPNSSAFRVPYDYITLGPAEFAAAIAARGGRSSALAFAPGVLDLRIQQYVGSDNRAGPRDLNNEDD